MSDIEGVASDCIRTLSQSSRRSLADQDREILAFFFALQWARHRFLLGALQSLVVQDHPVGEETDGNTLVLTSLVDRMVLAPWEAVRRGSAEPDEIYCSAASYLLGMQWALIRPRSDALIVSDNMVCLSDVAAGVSHYAPSRAWTMHGLGVGLGTCRKVTVPLTPRLAVAIARDERDTHLKSDQINRATVANSREFIAYKPGWPGEQPARYENVEQHLWVQRMLVGGGALRNHVCHSESSPRDTRAPW